MLKVSGWESKEAVYVLRTLILIAVADCGYALNKSRNTSYPVNCERDTQLRKDYRILQKPRSISYLVMLSTEYFLLKSVLRSLRLSRYNNIHLFNTCPVAHPNLSLQFVTGDNLAHNEIAKRLRTTRHQANTRSYCKHHKLNPTTFVHR